ncbi:alpha/beta hydrolase [Bergeyella sp. RCAD1439]|uniref:alpha/beta hydrolase n=1 Tax=Bergeyella anatis TaxID=3113737 RepID=UPI002E183CC4|nr:alpha/beta hydrolase [Bergeyella sp. RCAD1439]
MKIYVVSGLGADFKVLERLRFPAGFEVVFLDWLMPEKEEAFVDYVDRMADRIDDSAPFCLLGYSFGGIIVQEIHRRKPARKVIILGSIKSDKEKSGVLKWASLTRFPKLIPLRVFNNRSFAVYGFIRHFMDPENPKIFEYFRVRDPYYLKWSVEKISEWKASASSAEVIQILGDRDIVFPVKYSRPDYVIRGGTHLFPATKSKEVSALLAQILSQD